MNKTKFHDQLLGAMQPPLIETSTPATFPPVSAALPVTFTVVFGAIDVFAIGLAITEFGNITSDDAVATTMTWLLVCLVVHPYLQAS